MNKVKYGLSNVHYAFVKTDTDGVLTYDTPIKWPGAVSLSMTKTGNRAVFNADNSDYFVRAVNNGYDGTLETALIPDEFREGALGETKDTETGIYIEAADGATRKEFALLFQFEGDVNATRHCLLRCSADRPDINAQTTGDDIAPNTDSVAIRAMKRLNDSRVKLRVEKGQPGYDDFFKSVAEPTLAASNG